MEYFIPFSVLVFTLVTCAPFFFSQLAIKLDISLYYWEKWQEESHFYRGGWHWSIHSVGSKIQTIICNILILLPLFRAIALCSGLLFLLPPVRHQHSLGNKTLCGQSCFSSQSSFQCDLYSPYLSIS